ncbi:MBL fold metallo-hydrolase [Oxynema sp. CENA135]|uniref:MBL fold metallo-hydrolase n=1 Tax=Oxynema sp. CENA135 TaxID=984206 RepID=UPI00190A2DF8|nr:MBL fold metallo-hydrolase [Oxynema sp. CENA135]MBK4730449.1 MBL fold metallo-hydrolase [Oxynema sp. CENA135]
MHLTWFDSNSWLIELAGKRILLDPWLVGPLVFGNLPWLFKGERHGGDRPIPENIDLILLSQGLEDHAHPPTLKLLDRALPVVASVNAARVARDLGFEQVRELPHSQTFNLDARLEIQAFPGAPIGPLLTENAYVLKDLETGTSLYYEPHGYPSPSLKEIAPVDVAITPIVDLTLPILGPIIQGKQTALDVARWLRPQVMLPTAAGGDVVFEGMLNAALRASGSAEDFRSMLAKNELSTQLIEVKPGARLEIPLADRRTNAV